MDMPMSNTLRRQGLSDTEGTKEALLRIKSSNRGTDLVRHRWESYSTAPNSSAAAITCSATSAMRRLRSMAALRSS